MSGSQKIKILFRQPWMASFSRSRRDAGATKHCWKPFHKRNLFIFGMASGAKPLFFKSFDFAVEVQDPAAIEATTHKVFLSDGLSLLASLPRSGDLL
jgi:hypothetical protein